MFHCARSGRCVILNACYCLSFFAALLSPIASQRKNKEETKRLENLSPKVRLTWKYLKQFCPKDYNEQMPPNISYYKHEEERFEFKVDVNTKPNAPWVKVSMQPLFVSRLSLKNMEFSVDANIDVIWEDYRLVKAGPEANDLVREIDVSKQLKLNDRWIYYVKLWRPDIIFGNSRGPKNVLIRPEQSLTDMILRYNPWLQKLTAFDKLTGHFFCGYSFKKYPFDEQQCKIQLYLEHSEDDSLEFITELRVEEISEIQVPPEYKLVSLSMSKCPNKYTPEHNLIECAEYVFHFQRIYAQHIMLLFVPSILIVSLSWISFWLDESAAPPRVALGLTTLLTLATQFNNAQKDLPSVSDIKAVDIWMFTCMSMVVASIVEFAMANYGYRRWLKTTEAKKTQEPKLISMPKPKYVYSVPRKHRIKTGNLFKERSKLKTTKKWRCFFGNCFPCSSKSSIDRRSRVLFPTAFLIFNIVFWVYYTV